MTLGLVDILLAEANDLAVQSAESMGDNHKVKKLKRHVEHVSSADVSRAGPPPSAAAVRRPANPFASHRCGGSGSNLSARSMARGERRGRFESRRTPQTSRREADAFASCATRSYPFYNGRRSAEHRRRQAHASVPNPCRTGRRITDHETARMDLCGPHKSIDVIVGEGYSGKSTLVLTLISTLGSAGAHLLEIKKAAARLVSARRTAA